MLGVLVTAGEYSTGMIRSTLAAVPRRLPVLWSKAAVFGLVALVVGTLGAFVAFLFGSGIVSGTPAAMSLSHAGVVRSLLGAGLYLGLVGVIGAALGALLRSVAGGISVLVATLMLIPGLISLLPSSWQDDISPYLPSNAGESMFALTHDSTTLSPGAGLLVFLGWTALALAGAAYRLVRSRRLSALHHATGDAPVTTTDPPTTVERDGDRWSPGCRPGRPSGCGRPTGHRPWVLDTAVVVAGLPDVLPARPVHGVPTTATVRAGSGSPSPSCPGGHAGPAGRPGAAPAVAAAQARGGLRRHRGGVRPPVVPGRRRCARTSPCSSPCTAWPCTGGCGSCRGPARSWRRAMVLVAVRVSSAVSVWDALFFLLSTATAAVALGLMVRIRRAQLAGLRERAARLEIERDQRSRLAAATERARVAREMHDIVGHNLSVIITLADGGAYATDVAPERGKEALQLIGDTGRQALGELRRVLGVLREARTAREPARTQPAAGHRGHRRAVRRRARRRSWRSSTGPPATWTPWTAGCS